MEGNLVIISGGTATNDLVPCFQELACNIQYVLPILDNGGSTSEIIRVIGGPAIGDIRSRLNRLIPDHNQPLRCLLSHRLSSNATEAQIEWNELVDGTHELWTDVSSSTKEIVRSFLIQIHTELLRRTKYVAGSTNNYQFKFEKASVGNLFLTGIRLFTGSLDSAIELFMKLADINKNAEVLACINTNFSYHIGAILKNGSIVRGQSQISHPTSLLSNEGHSISKPIGHNDITDVETDVSTNEVDSELSSEEDSGHSPQYLHPELRKSQLHFDKNGEQYLAAPIERVFYISPYGEEIHPAAHSKVVKAITNARGIIFSIGSLMTSIIPVVVLRGVGKALSSARVPKILLLNGCEDRETIGLEALDYVRKIVELAQYSISVSEKHMGTPWNDIVTHLLYMEDPRIRVDVEALETKGIRTFIVKRGGRNGDRFDSKDLENQIHMIISLVDPPN